MKQLTLGYLAIVACLSLFAFAAYGFDKHRARTKGRRVPEKTLHTISLLGGWPGAFAGQQVFRHKTQKVSYQVVFWLCVFVHLAVVAGVAYLLLWINGNHLDAFVNHLAVNSIPKLQANVVHIATGAGGPASVAVASLLGTL